MHHTPDLHSMIPAAAAFPGKDHGCKLRDSPCAACTGVRELLDQKSALGDRTADLQPPYLPKPPLSCVRFLVCSFQRQLGLALKHTEPWTRTWIFSDRSLSWSLACSSQQLSCACCPDSLTCTVRAPFLASLGLHHFPNPQRHLPGSYSTPDANLVSLESKQILQTPPKN